MRAIQWLCFITLFAVMFCFAVLTANGQTLRGDALGLRPTSMPATCNTGDLRIDSADSYRLKVCEGNVWQTTTANDNVMTALGDIIIGGASGVQTRLGIGTLSHVLQVSPSGVPAYGFITDGNVDAAAGIVDTKLATISTSGKVANSATTATDANFADSIVARDSSGDFTASTIFAALSGNASTASALASNPSDCASDTYANAIAASGNLTCATVTNAGLAGSIAASKLVGTDIATLGTVTTGTWNSVAIGTTYGGTNLTSYTTGDILYASGANTLAKLAIGTTSQVITVVGGVPAWQPPAAQIPVPPYTKQILSVGSGTFYLTYVFEVSTASATAGATYTNNSQTCTVDDTISTATRLYAACTNDPLTSGTLTKSGGTGDSSITFSSWVKPKWMYVIAKGSGGSGATVGSSTASAAGGITTFGSISAAAGAGSAIYPGGVGGDASGGNVDNIDGAPGQSVAGNTNPGVTQCYGGSGGGRGAGPGGSNGGATGGHALDNSGAGGGGGGTSAAYICGSGGGEGAEVHHIFSGSTLAASFSYSLPAGGVPSACSGGGCGTGGNGGSGKISARMHYNN